MTEHLILERLFGIIGRPLGHSFSAEYFNKKFETEHIDAEYRKFELPDIGDLMELLSEYTNLVGLNVTIPYKQLVIPYMDEMDEEAAEIGAVNVVKINWKDGEPFMKGYNTDIIGFRDSIRDLLTPEMTKALVLGTGGASKAVVYGLKSLGVEPTLVSRTPGEGMIGYDGLTSEVMATHKVIVNATPLGTYPDVDECPPIPYDLLTPEHLCFDLVYNPPMTLFLKKAQQHGAIVKNGHDMLLGQAEGAWKIWNE